MALVAAMVLGGARLAAARTEPMELIWHAPVGCPTEAQVEADVKHNLAGSGARPVPFLAVVGVRGPKDGRWEASLLFQAGDTRAERRFEAESCEAITAAATFIIALWAEGGADAPPPTPATPPPAAPQSQNPDGLSTAPDARPRLRGVVLMLNGLLDWGTMPDPPAGGMEASGGPIWTTANWRLRALAGLTFFPTRRTSFTSGTDQANFQLFEASTRGCLTFARYRFEIGPCTGVELAVMHGFGQALQDATQLWLSLLGSALTSWRISADVAVFARADLVVPTTRRTFEHATYGYQIYKVPAVAGRGAVGIELRF